MRSRFFLLLALSPAFLSAQVNLTVVNPGFEDISGETVYNEFTFGPQPGWSLYDPFSITSGGEGATYYLGTLNPSLNGSPGNYVNFPDGAPEGVRVGIAFSFHGSGGQGEWGFIQTLTDTLQAHTHYNLSVQIGNIASGVALDSTPYNLNGFPGYRVDLLAGSTVLASDNNSLAGSIPEGEFALSTISFSTGASHPQLGQSLAIRLVNLNLDDLPGETQDLEVDFDSVSLTATAIPEPATTAAVLALAALGLAAFARRRRAAHSSPPSHSSHS